MKPKRAQEPSFLTLLDDSAWMLRASAPAILGPYYLGTLPFLAALGYFCLDMERSAFALERLPFFALILAVLFVWMKTWQVVAMRRVWGLARHEEPARMTPRAWLLIARNQTILQPWGLILYPLVMMLPAFFPWIYATFQNITVLDEGEDSLDALLRRVRAHANTWPRQNMLLVWAASPALLMMLVVLLLALLPAMETVLPALFMSVGMFWMMVASPILLVCNPLAAVVALNFAAAWLLAPQLLHMLFGIETFSGSYARGLISHVLLLVAVLSAHACLDPLIKTAYVLRCFSAGARQSGEDLLSALKKITCVALVAGGLLLSAPARAENAPLDAGQLDAAVESALRSPDFAWRMPKPPAEESSSWIAASVKDMVRATVDAVKKALKWFGDWWDKLWRHRETQRENDRGGNTFPFRTLSLIVLALLLIPAVWWSLRAWMNRSQEETVSGPAAKAAAPDLNDESVLADALPEDEWIALAQTLAASGEYRLAARAFFLATLSGLAREEWIRLARFKSNLDYARELVRYRHARPEVCDAFTESMADYERVWYGEHAATEETVERLRRQRERLGHA